MGRRKHWLWPRHLLECFAAIALVCSPAVRAQAPATAAESDALRAARHEFYSGKFEAAAAAAAPLTQSGPDILAAYELRTSALHFQLKRLLDDAPNKNKAFKQCATCQPLVDAFMKDLTAGKVVAREVLKKTPQQEAALFYLGKLDLNYVWLQLSTLGRRTGWGEYWNARHSIDAVLAGHPANIRARVARAWIDYIVDTRVPFGMKWMLGGGDKKKGLKSVMDAAAAATDHYDKTEAEFALWEMLVREKRRPEAVEVAKRLIKDFPDNPDLQRFIAK